MSCPSFASFPRLDCGNYWIFDTGTHSSALGPDINSSSPGIKPPTSPLSLDNEISVLGHAIQCRVTIENLAQNFQPDTGVYRLSGDNGVWLMMIFRNTSRVEKFFDTKSEKFVQ
ncbi:18403_t:CDS:2, partial [Dentiscutata erythropus]